MENSSNGLLITLTGDRSRRVLPGSIATSFFALLILMVNVQGVSASPIVLRQSGFTDSTLRIKTAATETAETQEAGKANDLLEDYRKARNDYEKELSGLASKCIELGKGNLSEFTLKWTYRKDPSRDYLFPLPNNRSIEFPVAEGRIEKFWLSHFQTINGRYASQLFALARKANESDRAELGFRWLHECLACDPGHDEAARVLGIDNEFNVRANPYRKREKLLPSGDITKYESDHFQVFTTLGEDQAKAALRKFEKWHIAWKQYFYDYWAHPTYLSRRFAEDAKPLARKKKFRVVLYPSRAEYVNQLKTVSPGIEVSTGYYLFSEKTSFFYPGDGADEKTWIHELTHQFMHETIPVSTRTEIRSSLWAVEGIAMFMESLTDFQTHMTVGGEDAERLNYCRYHYFREGFYVPMSELNPLDQRQFVELGNLKQLYSLCAAYCHFVLRQREIKPEFLKFLQMVHQGKRSDVFFDRISLQLSFDQSFKEFLKPQKNLIMNSLVDVTRLKILYLGNSDVDDQALGQLKDAAALESLDLTGVKVTDLGIGQLAQLKSLKYLSLERTKVTDQSMPTIGSFEDLEELDLTTTAVTDGGIAKLERLQNLEALWAGGTPISDAAVESINRLKGLKQLDIRKTEISASGKKSLNPKVKLID